MNLKELRDYKFEEKFIYMLEKIKFEVAQDQDYLNRLCKGRVTLVDRQWDCMPLVNATTKREDIKAEIFAWQKEIPTIKANLFGAISRNLW